jgi:hypothetical protein
VSKRPPVVRIIGQRVETVYGKRAPAGIAFANEPGAATDGAVGRANIQYGKIAVESDQSEDQQADTALHEWLHIMLLMAGLGHQEEVVNRLSPILLDFLRRNPRAVEYLVGGGRRLVRW